MSDDEPQPDEPSPDERPFRPGQVGVARRVLNFANENDLNLRRIREQADKILAEKRGIEPPIFGGITPRRVQADKVTGICEKTQVRRNQGVLPGGDRGDFVKLTACTLDIL